MKYLIIVVSLLVLSCGPSQKLRKAEKLIAKAIEQGAEVKNDTIYKNIRLSVPGVAFNTTLSSPNWNDTLYIRGKDSTIVKIKRIPGPVEKLFVEVKQPAKTIVQKVPVVIEREIKAGYTLWQVAILSVICITVGIVAGQFINLFK